MKKKWQANRANRGLEMTGKQAIPAFPAAVTG